MVHQILGAELLPVRRGLQGRAGGCRARRGGGQCSGGCAGATVHPALPLELLFPPNIGPLRLTSNTRPRKEKPSRDAGAEPQQQGAWWHFLPHRTVSPLLKTWVCSPSSLPGALCFAAKGFRASPCLTWLEKRLTSPAHGHHTWTQVSPCGGDAQTSTRHGPEHPSLPPSVLGGLGGTPGALTGRRLRGGFGQGGVQRAQPALHHAEALGKARLLPLQQLLHLPDGGQELLPAEAALWGRGGCSASGHLAPVPGRPHQPAPGQLQGGAGTGALQHQRSPEIPGFTLFPSSTPLQEAFQPGREAQACAPARGNAVLQAGL